MSFEAFAKTYMRSSKLRFGKARGAAQHPRDLRVRIAFDIVQPNNSSTERRQPGERLNQIRMRVYLRIRRPCQFHAAHLFFGVERQEVPVPGRAQIHEALAHRDTANPTSEGALARIRSNVAQQLDEGVLEQVIRDRCSRYEPANQRVYGPPARSKDLLMRLRIAIAGGTDDFGGDVEGKELGHRLLRCSSAKKGRSGNPRERISSNDCW